MQGFETITNSIMTLALAMLVGFVCVKTKYITEEQKNALSKVIVRVTLPLLVITSLTNQVFDHETLMNSIKVLIISLVVIGFLYIIGVLMSRPGNMEKSKAVMHTCMTCFGNVVFMAYPLIQALYGAEGLLYAAIFGLANDMYLWTVGVYRMASIKKRQIVIFGQSQKSADAGYGVVYRGVYNDGVRVQIHGHNRGGYDGHRLNHHISVNVFHRRHTGGGGLQAYIQARSAFRAYGGKDDCRADIADICTRNVRFERNGQGGDNFAGGNARVNDSCGFGYGI